VVILGAGAAGVGIADQIAAALKRAGLADQEVSGRIAMLDSQGLLVEGRSYREGEEYKQKYSIPSSVAAAYELARDVGITLDEVVQALKPSVLIGTSGQPGAFTESVIRAMAEGVERPLVFPFSNPTAKSEATPSDVIAWSGGRGFVATGSPFAPVKHDGKVHRIGQGNNVFIFPGVGLGALVVGATEVTDSMFTVAAETLADQVSTEELAAGQLYPNLRRLRQVSRVIAAAVAREAMASNVAPVLEEEVLVEQLSSAMWEPVYPDLEPA
jgi:malic enzyme